jgi:hypothetical protein
LVNLLYHNIYVNIIYHKISAILKIKRQNLLNSETGIFLLPKALATGTGSLKSYFGYNEVVALPPVPFPLLLNLSKLKNNNFI